MSAHRRMGNWIDVVVPWLLIGAFLLTVFGGAWVASDPARHAIERGVIGAAAAAMFLSVCGLVGFQSHGDYRVQRLRVIQERTRDGVTTLLTVPEDVYQADRAVRTVANKRRDP